MIQSLSLRTADTSHCGLCFALKVLFQLAVHCKVGLHALSPPRDDYTADHCSAKNEEEEKKTQKKSARRNRLVRRRGRCATAGHDTAHCLQELQ
jgi:hypothetical protein